MAYMRSLCSCQNNGCSTGVVSHSAFCFSIMLLMLFSLNASTLRAQNTVPERRYNEQNPVVYVDSWHNWPYAFVNDKGEADGLSVDIVRRVMAQLGVPCVVRLLEPNEMRRQMLSGEADITIGATDRHNINYGVPGRTTLSIVTNSILMPRRDSTKRFEMEQLHQVRHLTVQQDSRAYHYLLSHGFTRDEVNVVDNMDDYANQCVAKGQGGIMWNTLRLQWWLNKYNVHGYRLIPVSMPAGRYRFIANDTALLERMDSIAGVMQRSGMISRMEDKWIYPDEAADVDGEPYLIVVVSVLVAFLLFLLIVLVLLRRHYRRRDLRDAINEMRLSLRASGARVWVYYPHSHTFAWMSDEGETQQEYLSYDFSHFYPEGEFNNIYYHIKNYEHHNGEPITEVVRCYTSENAGLRKERLVQVRMTPVLDEYSNIYLIIGVQYDIDDGERDTSELSHMAERYHSAVEKSVVGIMCFDADGVLTDVNQRVLYILGIDDVSRVIRDDCNGMFTMYDIIGKDLDADLKENVDMSWCMRVPLDRLTDVFPFADPSTYRKEAVIYTAVQEADYEVKRERSENPNRYYYMRLISANDEDGIPLGYRLYIRDITDQVHVRRATMRLEKRIDTVRDERDQFHDYCDVLMRHGDVDSVRYDIDKRKVFFNARQGNQFRTFTQLQLLSIIDLRDVKCIYRVFSHMDGRLSRTLNVRFRTRLRDKDRNRQEFYLYMRPRFDEQGKVVSYFGFARNITQLSVMRRRLDVATKKAAEAGHLQQNFLRSMSYAIRQPLFAIQNSIERYMNTQQDNLLQRLLDNIKGNTRRLINLSDDTLLLSRLEAGMFHVRNEEIDFVPLFRRTVEDTFEHYENPLLTLDVVSPHEKLMICADANILRRVIQEAVGLSARYTKAGQITVRYYITRRRLLSIMVEDNGQGIPPQVQTHIFELQAADALAAEQTTADAVSGLEIPICHALVKACGGKMEIESTVGEGTSIYIELPVM